MKASRLSYINTTLNLLVSINDFFYSSSITGQIMKGLKIEEHANKLSESCSGGTKRKLSYGMAMLGDPKIVLMDEPSSGMDPQSKRFVWDTILASFKVNLKYLQQFFLA